MTTEEIDSIHKTTLLKKVVAVHQIYFVNKSYLNMFSDLVSQMPSILKDLKKNLMSTPDIKVSI